MQINLSFLTFIRKIIQIFNSKFTFIYFKVMIFMKIKA